MAREARVYGEHYPVLAGPRPKRGHQGDDTPVWLAVLMEI